MNGRPSLPEGRGKRLQHGVLYPALPPGPEMPSFTLEEVRPGRGSLRAPGDLKVQPQSVWRGGWSCLGGTCSLPRTGQHPGCAGHFSAMPLTARQQRGLEREGRAGWDLSHRGWWPGVVRWGRLEKPREKELRAAPPPAGKPGPLALGLSRDPRATRTRAEGLRHVCLSTRKNFPTFRAIYQRNVF